MKEITFIIPAYNEAGAIGNVVRELKSLYEHSEIIVVNDGSSDDTGEEAKKAGALVYNHPYRIGKGAAIKTGIRIASGEVFVFLDGNGEHDLGDIGKLFEYFPEFDMVVGSRTWLNGDSSGQRFRNWMYGRLASYMTGFPIKDLTSGLSATKADVARHFLYLLPNTYSYATTLTLSVLRSGRSLKYVTVETEKGKSENKKVGLLEDSVRCFLIITKICTLYSPFRIFLPISFFFFLLGGGYYTYSYLSWGRFTNMSALLFTTSVIIFMIGLVSEQICQMRFEKSENIKFLS